jgi:hypothetical protein
VGAIIMRTNIVAGRESGKVVAGSIKHAPHRYACKPTPARHRRRHLHHRCKGLPKMSSDGSSILEESRTKSELYETGE